MSKNPTLNEMVRGLIAFGQAWTNMVRSYFDQIARAFDPAANEHIDRLACILDQSEMETVRAAIRSERIDPKWAARAIAFGCPIDRLAEADQLATATGGDRESVERWIVAGRLEEALFAMQQGRLGEMYEEQP